MGKVPKLRKQRPQSQRSRAARREQSPSQGTAKAKANGNSTADAENDNMDNSIYTYSKSDPDTAQASSLDAVLARQSNAGVSKKKKQKPLSRAQRLRRERGVARADAVSEQLAVKVRRSKEQGRKIKARSNDWEVLNGGKGESVAKGKQTIGSEDENGDGETALEMGDHDMLDVSEPGAGHSTTKDDSTELENIT